MNVFFVGATFFLVVMAGQYVLLRNASENWRSGVRRMLHVDFVALVVAGLLGTTYLYVTAFAVDGPTLEQGQQRAEGLLSALERYKAAEGLYPPDLDALVPQYLVEIPRPAWRSVYVYGYRRCMSGERYVLAFKEAKIPDGSCACSSYSGECKCSGDLPWNWQESCNW